MRILLVEDDVRVAAFIRRGLKEEEYTVDLASDGDQAIESAASEEYDLIILDVMLPKKNGLDVLRTLRQDGLSTPVLILTAKDELKDKVEGLNAGADDYLTKPFGFEELLARVRALLRRRGDVVPNILRVADLELDLLKHKARRGGKEIELTSREYALLELLMRTSDHVVTRTMVADKVWEQDFDPLTNVIDVFIARLRRKIDDGAKTKLIHTLRGRGYILQSPAKSK